MERSCLHLGNGKVLGRVKGTLSAGAELYQSVLPKTVGNSLQLKSLHKQSMNYLIITAASAFSTIQKEKKKAKEAENFLGRGPC